MKAAFTRWTDKATHALGTPWALLLSVWVVIIWAVSGPWFDFSDTWQLIINTSTTVITFWMVFVIQASQNRHAKALMLKLDQLLEAAPKHEVNVAIGAEDLTEEEIDALRQKVLAKK
jgi:low affinity Fe/Cu permease